MIAKNIPQLKGSFVELNAISSFTRIETKSSNCSRATNATVKYNPWILKTEVQKWEKVLQEFQAMDKMAKHLFGRLTEYGNDIFEKIFSFIPLSGILSLRQASVICCKLVSMTEYFNPRSPLESKAALTFHYVELCWRPYNKFAQKKLEFAKNNTLVKFELLARCLIDESKKPLSILNSIPENRLNLILQNFIIRHVKDLIDLLSSDSKFIAKIIGIKLELEDIGDNIAINQLFTTLSNRLNLLPKFTDLSLGSAFIGLIIPKQLTALVTYMSDQPRTGFCSVPH